MTTTSAVSGSENWETYTDVSDDYEPEADARADYYAKMRMTKRGSSEDDYDGVVQNSGAGRKVKGYGTVRTVGHQQRARGDDGHGSEAGWTDVDAEETF